MSSEAEDSRAAPAGLADYFSSDHRRCDESWADVEAAAEESSGDAIRAAWCCFEENLRRHLAMEEELLFPAFEAATGMLDAGPSFVMRAEHAQMRGVLDQMAAAVRADAREELLDQGETLHILIQQHNMKEEGMLYPMAEQVLVGDWAALRAKLEAFSIA